MTRFLQALFGVTVIQVSAFVMLTHPLIGMLGVFAGWLFFLAPIVRVARDYDDLTRRQ